jgi:hypothetical protein
VDGLTKDKSAIRRAMEGVAREMVTTLKKELKSKSPSQIFMEMVKIQWKDWFSIADSSKKVTDGC